MEEVILSGAAANADSTGEGAATVKFVTRSGTNEFHGGAFWQNRNTFFAANSYFNTINRLPRNTVHLNQYGFHVGGPVDIPKILDLKNKLFFFTNVEFREMPQSAGFSRTSSPRKRPTATIHGPTAGVVRVRSECALARQSGWLQLHPGPDPR